MSKAIMISIRPEWVAKILSGEKTIEIRKTAPKCDLPIEVYVYCTKSNDYHLDWGYGKKHNREYFCWEKKAHHYPFEKDDIELQSQKVLAKFTLNKVEKIYPYYDYTWEQTIYRCDSNIDICGVSCIDNMSLANYLNEKDGYAWYIDNLQIFDKAKELKDFNIKKAPQGWCYVEEKEND